MFHKGADPTRPAYGVLRALVAFVVILLGVGAFALATEGPAPAASPGGPTVASFGFALAAGAIALMATILMSRPRLRFRR